MYEKIILKYEEDIKNEVNKVDALTLLGRIAFKEQNIKKAVEYYKEVFMLENNNKEALYFISMFFIYAERKETALIYLNKLIDLGLENTFVYENIGFIKNGEVRRKYFNKAIEMHNNSKLIQRDFTRFNSIAFKMYNEGYFDIAEKYALLAFSIRNTLETMNLLGCINYKIGEYDKALSYFHDINARLPTSNTGIICNIAYTYKQKGSYKMALMYLKKAIDFSVEDERIYYIMGDVYLASKDESKAFVSFRDALSINPNYKLANDILENMRS